MLNKNSEEISISTVHDIDESISFSVNPRITALLKKAIAELVSNGQEELARNLNEIYKSAVKKYFTLAVVGEFSRGKSSFINSFLKKEFLPVGNLPTTAILTKIKYSQNEFLNLVNKNGKQVKALSLSETAWDNLTADSITENLHEMTAEVGLDSAWLAENGVELIDTPGAGDLSEKSAVVIGNALLSSDGAVVTVSATQALSMSEKLFIEQRLIARKTPFMIMIITKLDQVPKEERSSVIDYIMQRLELWKMKIPVYIPYPVEMPDDKYQDIMGMDIIKEKITAWIQSPERIKATENWIIARMISVIELYLTSLHEQSVILNADNEKQKKLIEEKKQKLSDAELMWNDLRIELMKRSNICYQMLLDKADEYKSSITEKLQKEVWTCEEPQKWWTDEYPYRLRIELASLSAGIEELSSEKIAEDADWFNTSLEESFQTNVLYKKEIIYDENIFENSVSVSQVQLEDLTKEKNVLRAGAVLLTVAGFAICSSIGFIPIIATIGIGTGAGIISQKIFKDKLEQQKKEIQKAIAQSIPAVIEESLNESEERLKTVYDTLLEEADKKEQIWLKQQNEVIEETAAFENESEKLSVLESEIKYFETLKQELETL